MAASGKRKRLGPRQPTNLLTSLSLVFPLLVFYEVGVLFTDTMNGADLLTQSLIDLLGRRGFLWVQLGLVVAVLGVSLYLRRKQQFNPRQFVPVVLESAIYALTMGTLIVFVMVDLLHVDPRLAVDPLARAGVFQRLVMAVGAGVHEELVFRLLIMGSLIRLGTRTLGLSSWLAVVVAIAVSSLLFSAAHHVGPLGEPLRMGAFVYRTLAGVLFALLYRYRSFAIAVYTHTLYDVYVMLLR